MVRVRSIALLFWTIVRWPIGLLSLIISLFLFLGILVGITLGKLEVEIPIEVQGVVLEVRNQHLQEKTVIVQYKPKKLAWTIIGGPEENDKHAIAHVTSEDLAPVKGSLLTPNVVHVGDRVSLLYDMYEPHYLRIGSLSNNQKSELSELYDFLKIAVGYLFVAIVFLFPYRRLKNPLTAPRQSSAPAACSGPPV